jgi:hypothetical protein
MYACLLRSLFGLFPADLKLHLQPLARGWSYHNLQDALIIPQSKAEVENGREQAIEIESCP